MSRIEEAADELFCGYTLTREQIAAILRQHFAEPVELPLPDCEGWWWRAGNDPGGWSCSFVHADHLSLMSPGRYVRCLPPSEPCQPISEQARRDESAKRLPSVEELAAVACEEEPVSGKDSSAHARG